MRAECKQTQDFFYLQYICFPWPKTGQISSNSIKSCSPSGNAVNLTHQAKMPLGLFPVLLPITVITVMIAGVLHVINDVHLSLLCQPQLLPSIVAPWLRKHNVRTARRSGSVVLLPAVKRSRGRSRDPGSVFGHIITNRKSLQASHTGPLPPFVYRRGWIKLHLQSCTHVCCSIFHFAPISLQLSASLTISQWTLSV